MRIDIIYDAVVDLKKLEDTRTVKPPDIEAKYVVAAKKVMDAEALIMKQEARLAEELMQIGDGGETVQEFARLIEASLPTAVLNLRAQQLHAVCLKVSSYDALYGPDALRLHTQLCRRHETAH